MDHVMALTTNLPLETRRIAGGEVGNGANRGSAENAMRGVVGGRVVLEGDFLKIRKRLVEKLILLVVAAKEQAKIPATGI